MLAPYSPTSEHLQPTAQGADGLSGKTVQSGRALILFNFVSLGIQAIIKNLLGFIRSIYARRVLDLAAIGQISWSAAVVSYFSLVVNPGLWTLCKREVARDPRAGSDYVSALFVLQFAMALVSVAWLAGIAWAVAYAHAFAGLLVVQSLTLFLLAFDLAWLIHAHEDMKALAIGGVIANVCELSMLPMLVRRPHDAVPYVAIPLVSQAALNIFSVVYATRRGYFHWRDLRWPTRLRALLFESLPIGFSQATTLVYYNSDSLILGLVKGDSAVGYYSTAYSLMLIPTYLSFAMQNAFFPALARAKEDGETARTTSILVLKSMAWLGMGLSVLGWSVGGNVVTLLYGPAYSPSAKLFEWLSLGLFLIFVDAAYLQPLNAWGHQKEVLACTLTAAAANLGLNLWLLPLYGASAAVLTTLLAEVVVITATAWVRRNIVPVSLAEALWRVVLAGVGVALVTRALTLLVPWWATVAPCGLLFIGCFAVTEPALFRAVAAQYPRRRSSG